MRTLKRSAVLDADAVATYRRTGMLFAAGLLPADVVCELLGAASEILAQDGPRRITERDGVTIRSVYGPHQTDPFVSRICRRSELAGAAMEILGKDVYIHQSKINVKAPFVGDKWEWHQDYIYWLNDDGIRTPDLVNVAVFLDEVTEFNGPLTFVPCSHNEGVLATVEKQGLPVGYEDAPQWVSTLTAAEKHRVRHDVIARLATAHGMVSPKGPAGSVLFFHPNILHASSPNISPYARTTLLTVYNSVSNPATNTENPRPAFLAARDTGPVKVSS